MRTQARQHDMPFGTAILPDGSVAFRLWAPAARQVELCLGEDPRGEPARAVVMEQDEQGWAETVLHGLAPGTHYFFRIDNGLGVPDPASRFQPRDIHGPSELVDPRAWQWGDGEWRGRPWEEAVVYELHVGTFSEPGNFLGAREMLDYLVELGVTAIELMPVAEFPGRRNWGYDGVLLFAPDSAYGRPEDLKALVDAAHARGLMVLLDVVYNHFGPEGNYLRAYSPQFFNGRHHTPWGEALNFDGDERHWVREYFIHNALFWLEEYHLDGLRFDAVHAIMDADDSRPDFLSELGQRLRAFQKAQGRHIHLVLENEHNSARYLRQRAGERSADFTAQWNDDLHHCLHVLLTEESAGYYCDYTTRTLDLLGRCLSEGFAYQGEASSYLNGKSRGEDSRHLSPGAFLNFLQNHDQIGNRAFGERIAALAEPAALRAATALLLLAPSPPMLFMGQEWGSTQPFLYFCDFTGDLALAVRDGRRQEFSRFPAFADPAARGRIPDPNAPETFTGSRLDWQAGLREGSSWLALHKKLLTMRREEIIPRLAGIKGENSEFHCHGAQLLEVCWRLGDGTRLRLLANLSGEGALHEWPQPRGRRLYGTHDEPAAGGKVQLPAWSVFWHLQEKETA